MFRKSTFIFLLLFLPVVLSLSSCANRIIAQQMVGAPNSSILGSTVNNQFELINQATDKLIELNGLKRKFVNLPHNNLTISYFDIAPGNYGYEFETYPVVNPGGKIGWIHTHWYWQDKHCFDTQFLTTPKGTLVMLHGWARDNRSLLSYAIEFAQMGYRVLVPDLRGHGQSNGEWLSFGHQESLDIHHFANALNLQDFDLFGFSLGAATAIHLASFDERVQKLIAVAAMDSIKGTIPKFAKRSRPWIAALLKDKEQDIVDTATDITGYNFQETSDTLSAIEKVHQPALLVFGENDQMSDAKLNRTLFHSLRSDNKAIQSMQYLRHTFVLQHQSELVEIISDWLQLAQPSNTFVKTECIVNSFVL